MYMLHEHVIKHFSAYVKKDTQKNISIKIY